MVPSNFGDRRSLPNFKGYEKSVFILRVVRANVGLIITSGCISRPGLRMVLGAALERSVEMVLANLTKARRNWYD
jgi:hypothetical protein